MVKAKTTQGKRLQPGSVLEKYDIDDDGEITDNEINDLTKSADLLATMAPTYFIAAAGVAGAFMGVTAWMNKK